jgi:hypothetical protein
MARKKSTRPRRKKGENPFLPALLSLHERWTPEQIAAVLTGIDEPPEWVLSRQLVLLLSKMPQIEEKQRMEEVTPCKHGHTTGKYKSKSDPSGHCKACRATT